MKVSKKILALVLATTVGFAVVGCSSETTSVDEGTATKQEETKETSAEAETKKEEIVLVDDETVKITVTGKTVDMLGAGLDMVIENKTDKKIVVQTRETSIDGTMEEPMFSEEITPGKTAKGMMQFMNITELEKLKNIEGNIVVIDAEDFITEYGTYTFNVK